MEAELVNGARCAKHIGISAGHFSALVKKEIIPVADSSGKRPKFDLVAAKAAAEAHGVKSSGPRKKAGKVAVDPREEQLKKFLTHLIKRAHKRAAKAYRGYLLGAAAEAKGDADVDGLELLILRHVALVDGAEPIIRSEA